MTRRSLLQLLAAAAPWAYLPRALGEPATQTMTSSGDANLGAELLIVPPRESPGIVNDFVGRCVVGGIHFYFEPNDALPSQVPAEMKGLRAIVIEDDEVVPNADAIAQHEAAGTRIYRMSRDKNATIPNTTLAWTGELTFQAICFDAGLTFNNPSARKAMVDRPDERLLNDLGGQILLSENLRWYDTPRYQWESMLDGYEMTGEQRYLDVARRQILHAIENIPNDLSNCDCVAPLVPILRLYEVTHDRKLLDYSISTFDQYLAITPRCRGCLVNFGVYGNNIRSEILWQVLPGMMELSRVSGLRRYADLAMDEFTRLHELLFDREQSLWSHGVGPGGKTPGFWARGVAFGILGNLAVLEGADASDKRRELCAESFRRNAARLRELQGSDGFWCCVPDQPGSARESSGTAWICAALERGIRNGWLDESYRVCADLAWQAVKSRIWQGRYPGHMVGTTVSLTSEYYLKKPLSETGWSHFAFRALAERQRTALGKR